MDIELMQTVKKLLFCALLSLLAVGMDAQVTKWRDMYKVKKKDTMYGIAKKYGITIDELKKANPDMTMPGYELKKGDYIFIPFTQTTNQNKPSTSANTAKQPSCRIGVMLPLHNVDGDGRRMVEYYRGLLLACDNLKQQGYSIDVKAWNLAIDTNPQTILSDPKAKQLDIIFGPLYTKQVSQLAQFCKQNDIKLVIPFSINGDEVQRNDHVWQVYQTPAQLNDAAISAFLERMKGHHPIFIDCNDTTSRKGVFTFTLRRKLEEKGIKASITNLNSSDEMFAKCFSKSQPNVVVLNTGRSPELNAALAKLNRLTEKTPGLVISLFGYTDWLMYTRVYENLFYKYDTYIPTSAFYNAASSSTKTLEDAYRAWFGESMQQALPRFALTGYDQAQFFIRGLKVQGKKFRGTKGESSYQPLQTPLKFKYAAEKGGLQNSTFMLIHYKYDRTIESISY